MGRNHGGGDLSPQLHRLKKGGAVIALGRQAEVFFGHDYDQARAWQRQGWLQ